MQAVRNCADVNHVRYKRDFSRLYAVFRQKGRQGCEIGRSGPIVCRRARGVCCTTQPVAWSRISSGSSS